MNEFDSNSFDLAWFSFNGIDYVATAGRVRILEEVRRILRPGGTFCFSSHNLRQTVETAPATSDRFRVKPQPAPAPQSRDPLEVFFFALFLSLEQIPGDSR